MIENAIIGLGILIGFSLLFSILSGLSLDTLLPSLYIMSVFVSWLDLLPSELSFIFLILNVIYLFYSIKKKREGN